jgi:hypothetical protein
MGGAIGNSVAGLTPVDADRVPVLGGIRMAGMRSWLVRTAPPPSPKVGWSMAAPSIGPQRQGMRSDAG